MSGAQPPFGGAGDSRAGDWSLAERFRRHAESIARGDRSPLYRRLMEAAAADIEAGGVVAELFEGMPVPPGSVPQLRLLAALHELVLSGGAPELARFYPSVGGTLSAEGAWPAVTAAVSANFDWIRARIGRTVQTNEPGRAAVLYAALLWLTARHRRPIRLLELGASAGLNLLVDRYCYVINGVALGDRSSPVRFEQPWAPGPAIDLPATNDGLEIFARAGCDLSPLKPGDPEDRLRLVSYIWPDESERIARVKAALELAATAPSPICARRAAEWLPEALSQWRDGELTVIWHSLFRQYVSSTEWKSLQRNFAEAAAGAEGGEDRVVVWLSMEPGVDHQAGVELSCREGAGGDPLRLATCDDHGPPIRWTTGWPGPR